MSQPSAWSTRAVAALTPGKNAPCTQPVSRPTTARRCPAAGMRSGSGCGLPSRGASRSIAASWGATRSSSPVRRSARSSPLACSSRRGPRSRRNRRGCGNSENTSPRRAFSFADRSWWRSTWARVCSIRVSYCTPDGHAVTQAMQPEAGVEVRDHRVGHRLALEALLHQVDPAARRVHLLAPQHVGRTGGQAEPAVHAVADQRRVGWVVLVEGAADDGCPQVDDAAGLAQVAHISPTNRPGESRWSASNWSLTRRIRSSAGTGPHTSTAAFTAAGASTTTALPPARVQVSRIRRTASCADSTEAPASSAA